MTLNDLDRPTHPVMFLVVTEAVGGFVNIAVIPDLVPIFYNSINRGGMIFNTPSRYEKALFKSKPSVSI